MSPYLESGAGFIAVRAQDLPDTPIVFQEFVAERFVSCVGVGGEILFLQLAYDINGRKKPPRGLAHFHEVEADPFAHRSEKSQALCDWLDYQLELQETGESLIYQRRDRYVSSHLNEWYGKDG